AYTGYARIATLAEEVREPRRTIPRAIMITLGASILLYLAVSTVAVGAVGAGAMARTASPLEAAARASPVAHAATVVAVAGVTAAGARPGAHAAPAVAVAGVTGMLGVILSQLLGLSRMAFAMARGGDLPAALGAVHARYHSPGRAVVLIGAVAAVVAATGTLA